MCLYIDVRFAISLSHQKTIESEEKLSVSPFLRMRSTIFSLHTQDLVQGKLLPGGEKSILGDEIIYSTATKEYTGTYVCTGDNGDGNLATDKIMVTIKCEKRF